MVELLISFSSRPRSTTIRSPDAYAQDEARHALANPGRRRLRGYTAQYLLTAVLIAAANIGKIVSYLKDNTDDSERAPDETPPKSRAKRRKVTLPKYRPEAQQGTDPPR